MVDVTTEIAIRKPVDLVYAYVADQRTAPEWYENIESVELRGEPAVGSRFTFVARFLGRTLTYTYEITELIEQRKLVMRTADGPFEMETTYEWRKLGEAEAAMSLRNRGNPTGFSKLAAPLMSAAMRRANNKDLRRLKSILERPAAVE